MVVNQKSYIFMILFRLTTANITVYSLKTTIHISLINSYVDFYIAFFWRILASATAAKPPRHVPVNKLMECRFCFCKIVTEYKACEPPKSKTADFGKSEHSETRPGESCVEPVEPPKSKTAIKQ